MKFHPNRNQDDPEAEKKFKQLQWAYERFRKQKRPHALTSGDDAHWSHFADSEDTFLNLFTAVRSHYMKKKAYAREKFSLNSMHQCGKLEEIQEDIQWQK
jgi:DnaJ-class molecular chaperone